jgi:hypothetical protein
MTCIQRGWEVVIHMAMHDILFHVIFGHDRSMIREFLQASSARLQSIVHCRYLESTMEVILHPERGQEVPLDTLKALFFLFLNVDMVLKNYVCKTNSRDDFAAAMNMRRNSPDLNKLHAWSMVGTRAISQGKAVSFFVALHNVVVKQWLQDERRNPSDLVEAVKDQYLVS